jgi:hypothetical protein
MVLLTSLLTSISMSSANAAVAISSQTATNWQTNTGTTFVSSTLYNSQTGWTVLISSSQDDSYTQIPFPAGFTTTFNGTAYSSVFAGSNTYLTFGSGSSNYSGLSASNPAIPGVHMCAKDNSWQLLMYKYENSNNTVRIRYEGNGSTSGTAASPGIIYEAVFYKNASYFDISMGINNSCTAGSTGATNGSTYQATFPTGSSITNQYFRVASGLALSSFSSSQSTPTSSTSPVTYSLVATESITGLAATDFANAGTATGCSFAVTGSGTTYSVTVSSCSAGTVIPRLLANSVTGASSGTGPTTNADASSTVTLDFTAPTASVTTRTISPSSAVNFQSTEIGTGYIVKNSVTVSNVSSITGSSDAVWNQATVSAANTNISMSASGLEEGTYKIYASDAAGNLSTASSGTVTIGISSCTDSGSLVTCNYTGDVQKWVVPSGMTTATFTVTGASGVHVCRAIWHLSINFYLIQRRRQWIFICRFWWRRI